MQDFSTHETTAPTLDVRPMSGYTGAEIVGVDLTALTPPIIAEIRAALLQWKVAFFRDQDLTPEQHIDVGRCFGEVTAAHPIAPPSEHHPEILIVDSAGVSTGFDARWHTDLTYLVNPPAASILRSVVVPPYGGDTQFLNLATAYCTLSPEVRDLVDKLHAVHGTIPPMQRGLTQDYAAKIKADDFQAVHPVVRVHPDSGERVLFVNPNFTRYICELPRKESNHILAMLYEHLMSPEFTCRFRWAPGSVAFWDNRATCHLVPIDIPDGAQRVMHRITLRGDVPVGVDGEPSHALVGTAFA